MKKQILIIFVIVFIVLVIVGVNQSVPGLHPTEQPGTTWSTKDGTVVFRVPDKDAPLGTPSYGTIRIGTTTMEVAFAMSNLAGIVGVYTPEDYAKLQNSKIAFSLETWTEVTVKTDRFVVRVKSTTYFTEGQELVFFRVE